MLPKLPLFGKLDKIMKYETLTKIYYKNPDEHKSIYENRFNSPLTKHFDFHIKQFNHRESYPAFLCYTEELVLLLEKIYKRYETFLYTVNTMPPVVLHQYSLSCIMDEVKSTNSIEGIHSTRREIKEVMEGVAKTPRFSSIIKKYDMLLSGENFNFKSCNDLRDFYEDFAHKEVCINDPNNKLDGEFFRKDFVDITSATGKILHRGIYPEEKIIESMDIALQILNDENIPLLVRISMFHYYFAYIHPFYDGNGRTVRFITSAYLAEHFHYLAALRISFNIKRQQKKYYNLFNETDSEINCGDMTPFVYGFISIILNTFDDVEEKLKIKLEQLNKFQEKLSKIAPNDDFSQEIYFILLQASLFFGQGISIEELAKLTHKSTNTIRSKLKSLPKEHIILRKNKKYFYKLNMIILKN